MQLFPSIQGRICHQELRTVCEYFRVLFLEQQKPALQVLNIFKLKVLGKFLHLSHNNLHQIPKVIPRRKVNNNLQDMIAIVLFFKLTGENGLNLVFKFSQRTTVTIKVLLKAEGNNLAQDLLVRVDFVYVRAEDDVGVVHGL